MVSDPMTFTPDPQKYPHLEAVGMLARGNMEELARRLIDKYSAEVITSDLIQDVWRDVFHLTRNVFHIAVLLNTLAPQDLQQCVGEIGSLAEVSGDEQISGETYRRADVELTNHYLQLVRAIRQRGS